MVVKTRDLPADAAAAIEFGTVQPLDVRNRRPGSVAGVGRRRTSREDLVAGRPIAQPLGQLMQPLGRLPGR